MMRRFSAVIGVFVLLAATVMSAEAAIAFGARTQVWPFMFVDGAGARHGAGYSDQIKSDVAIGNLDQYAVLDAEWNIVDVWQDIDGRDGYRRLANVIDAHEQRGIAVSLRLLERPELYDELRKGGAEGERALREYQDWLKGVASKFGARIRYYMISNEVDHDIGFNRVMYKKFRQVEFDEYARVLRAGYEAIKSVNGALQVTDHGVSSYSLCLAVMSDMVAGGDIDGALRFWQGMDYGSDEEGERSSFKLLRMLVRGDSRHRIEMARRTAVESQRYTDVFQLHHYFGPKVVPEVLRWLRARMEEGGQVRPILAAEVGYRMPMKKGKAWDGRPMNVADMDAYSEKDHGNSLARTIAALAGNGVEDILYWQMRFHNERSPTACLYPAAETRGEFRNTYPAEVFRTLVLHLSGAVPAGSAAASDKVGYQEYRFHKGRDFSLLWADGAEAEIPLALRDGIEAALGVDGRELDLAAGGWRVGVEPVLVKWRVQAGATP